MKHLCPFLVMAVACLPATAQATRTLKFAVIIGNNQGHDAPRTLRFAEQDARKMHDVLIQLGGFREENTRLILGQKADRVWMEIADIEARIAAARGGDGTRTLLLIYYSGHADGDVLELDGTALEMKRLLAHLRGSAADVRLAFLDSCRSGKMITMKGGRRGPGFHIQMTDEIASRGYAIVTSSAENELSQESREIRGAFFTHYLVSALRGAGDESRDGKITLSEAYSYAYRHTLARTSVTVGGSQHPMYEFQLEGRGDVVLTRTDHARSRIIVTLPESGRLVVLDRDRHSIVTESEITADKPSRLAVPAGHLHVYLIRPDGVVRAAEVTLSENNEAAIGAERFQTVSLEETVEKGGLFSNARAVIHTLSAGGLWRMFALEGASSSVGAAVLYRAALDNQLQPVVKLAWSTREDVGRSKGYNDVSAMAGLGYIIPIRSVQARAELLIGYEHMFQSPAGGERRHTSCFGYLGLVGVTLPKDSLALSLDGAVGGRTFQVIDKGWVHRLDLQLILSLGWQWGSA